MMSSEHERPAAWWSEGVRAWSGGRAASPPEQGPREGVLPEVLARLFAVGEDVGDLFHEILRPFVGRLTAFRFRSGRDLEELEGELGLELTRSFRAGKVPSDPASFEPWLRSTLGRLGAKWIRKGNAERKRIVFLAGRDPEDGASCDEGALESPTPRRITDLVHLLPHAGWRLVFRLLARKRPWSYERIASRLGVESGLVRNWVFRAKRFLQGLPPDVLRRPSEYAVARRGRGFAVIRRAPPGHPTSPPRSRSGIAGSVPLITESRSSPG